MTSTAEQQQVLDVTSPVSGATVGQVPVTSTDDISRAATRMRAAQIEWEAGGVAERARWLHLWRDWIHDNQSMLADLLLSESGKVQTDATVEAPLVADMINYFSKVAQAALADTHPGPHGLMAASKKLTVTHRAYPLVAVISPWNFPVVLPMMDTIPALMAGSAVVIKPSEVTPLALAALVDGWQEIGAPDVLACVHGDGVTGAALVDEVDYVQFTGSTRTGRKIAVRAAERLIPYGLELGGKDPMIVLADADLERASNAAVWGAMYNSGQTCVSVERVYVEAPVYDEFVSLVTRKVAALRSGGGKMADVVAMVNTNQLEIVTRHVDEAVKAGARATTGGAPTGAGLHFAPTVLVDVDHSMACMREETFGPTLPVMRVSDVDEAIRLANDTPYGLSASVWTRDIERAGQVADRLEAGAVNVNDVMANLFSFTLPHGGWKSSGIGARFGGEAAILKYCRAQARTVPRSSPKREFLWFPYTSFRTKAMGRVMRMLTGRGIRRWSRSVRG